MCKQAGYEVFLAEKMAKSSQDIKQGKAHSFALSDLENLIYE